MKKLISSIGPFYHKLYTESSKEAFAELLKQAPYKIKPKNPLIQYVVDNQIWSMLICVVLYIIIAIVDIAIIDKWSHLCYSLILLISTLVFLMSYFLILLFATKATTEPASTRSRELVAEKMIKKFKEYPENYDFRELEYAMDIYERDRSVLPTFIIGIVAVAILYIDIAKKTITDSFYPLSYYFKKLDLVSNYHLFLYTIIFSIFLGLFFFLAYIPLQHQKNLSLFIKRYIEAERDNEKAIRNS